jgi:hypothetical protein
VNQDLTPQQWQRAEENLTELLRVWFLSKADQYAALERSQQNAFLDGLIDTFLAMAQSVGRQAMSSVDPKTAAKLAGKAKSAEAQAALARLLTKWQQRTTAEEMARAATLLLALQERGKLRAVKKEAPK